MKYVYILLSVIVLFLSFMVLLLQWENGGNKDINATHLWIIFLACTIASIYYDYKKSK